MEEAHNRAIDKAKTKIVNLTSLVSIAEEKGKHTKKATKLQGTHDHKAGPTCILSTPL